MRLKIRNNTTKNYYQVQKEIRIAIGFRESLERDKRAKAIRRAKIKKFLLDAK